MRREQDVVRVGHDGDPFGFGNADPRGVGVDNVASALLEEVTELESIGILLPGADRHIHAVREDGIRAVVLGHEHVLPPAEVFDLIQFAPDASRFCERVARERVDQYLSFAREHLGCGDDAIDVAGLLATALGEAHFLVRKAAVEECLRVIAHFLGRSAAHALVGGNAVAKLAAQQLVDRHTGCLADDVPQRNVDACHCARVVAAAIAAQALGRVHLLPERLDLASVLTEQDRPEHVCDDGLHNAWRHYGVGLAPADDALVGRDFNQQRLPIAALPNYLGAFKAVP